MHRWIIALALSLPTTMAGADELLSGPQAGEKVNSFLDFGGTKCGGAATGRFQVGQHLRYY